MPTRFQWVNVAARHALQRSTVLLVAILVACGGGTTDVPLSTVEVQLERTVFTSITDSASLVASVNSAPASGVSIDIASETRDVPSMAVLSTAALARQWIVPMAPGTVTLRVRANGATTATVDIRVAPDRPTVLAATTTTHGNGLDTTTITGVLLDRVAAGALRVQSAAVELLARTPTSARFVLPLRENANCTGVAPAATLTIAGGDVASTVVVRQPRMDELRMAVGAWRRLDPAELECMRLPAARGAYVVAFADMRQVERARTGWPGLASPDDFTITATDRSSQATSANAAPLRAHAQRSFTTSFEWSTAKSPHRTAAATTMAPGMQQELECSDDDFTSPFVSFWCRSKPWQVGDRFRIRRPGSQSETAFATVYRIYDGKWVYARIDGDNSPRLEHMITMIDEAMPFIQVHGFPLFQTVFGSRYPTSSVGSGQMLTIVGDFVHGSVAGGCCLGGDPWSVMLLGSTLDGTFSMIYYLLAHEYTHAWQRRWYYDSRPVDADPLNTGGKWGSEGTADLVAFESARRMRAQPWRANVPVSLAESQTTPWNMEAASVGTLSQGYVHASAFMRDVVARLVVRGVPIDQAFTEVARGTYEDWFGFDPDNVKRAGFTQRMQSLIAGWEPADALLIYALSQGADELTNNPELQNPFYAAMSTDPTGQGLGSTTLLADQGMLSVQRTRAGTSVGYLRIEDGGRGSTVALSANREGIVWAIARVR